MTADSISTTFWLLATNVVLALAVILCAVMIGWCLMSDVRRLRRQRKDESLIPFDFLDGLENFGIVSDRGQEKMDETVKE